MFAMVTVISVLILEHLVSRAYERRLTRQLTSQTQSQGEQQSLQCIMHRILSIHDFAESQ